MGIKNWIKKRLSSLWIGYFELHTWNFEYHLGYYHLNDTQPILCMSIKYEPCWFFTIVWYPHPTFIKTNTNNNIHEGRGGQEMQKRTPKSEQLWARLVARMETNNKM